MKTFTKTLVIAGLAVLTIAAATVGPGLRIRSYPNDSNPPDDAAYILDETTTNKHILHSQLRLRMTNGLAAITYVNSLTNGSTNFAGLLASNNVRVAEGAGIIVNTQASGGTMVYTVTRTNTFDNVVLTNGVNRLRSLVPSTTTTQQINVATGQTTYYWTNMVTNVVCQLTNLWSAAVSNRTLDFFFTGATNGGPNYTVTFTCPNPGGVSFRWGLFSVTNGATSFTVTNNACVGASLTPWDTNLVECYFSPVR